MNKINYSTHNWLAFKINNESFLKNLSIIKGKVIDLGCGSAQYKNDILKVAKEYIGVDWKNTSHDRTMVDIYANLCEHLPFDDNSADTVVSFQVMEHLSEPKIFLSECYRILKPNASLLFTVPFMWHVHEAPYDFFRYTRYGLKYLLKHSGFNNIIIYENTGFWQTIILKINYHTTKFSRGPLKLLWIPIWFFGQLIAPILDRYDKTPDECASYTVLATK